MTEPPRIVTVPNRGLRCREPTCQAEIVMVKTKRGQTMPLDRDPVALETDERGRFIVLELPDPETQTVTIPTAVSLSQARHLGIEIPELVYVAHWGTCKAPSRFRR